MPTSSVGPLDRVSSEDGFLSTSPSLQKGLRPSHRRCIFPGTKRSSASSGLSKPRWRRRCGWSSRVDLRFKGQSYEINVPIRGDLRRAFHQAHRIRYGYASRKEAIEVVTVRLVVRTPRPFRRPRAPLHRGSRPRSRRVLFDDGWHDVPVHERSRLGVGSEIDGPAIVAEDHATTVVPPGSHLTVDRFGLLEVEVPR